MSEDGTVDNLVVGSTAEAALFALIHQFPIISPHPNPHHITERFPFGFHIPDLPFFFESKELKGWGKKKYLGPSKERAAGVAMFLLGLEGLRVLPHAKGVVLKENVAEVVNPDGTLKVSFQRAHLFDTLNVSAESVGERVDVAVDEVKVLAGIRKVRKNHFIPLPEDSPADHVKIHYRGKKLSIEYTVVGGIDDESYHPLSVTSYLEEVLADLGVKADLEHVSRQIHTSREEPNSPLGSVVNYKTGECDFAECEVSLSPMTWSMLKCLNLKSGILGIPM